MNKTQIDESYWAKQKAAWEESGLSQRKYCKQEGVCNRKFNYHIHRLIRHETKQEFKFIEAPLSHLVKQPSKAEGRVRLEFPNQVVIVLELSAELTLSRAIEAAGAFRCYK